MWSAITSDLKDFVSQVSEDTAAVASKVKAIGTEETDNANDTTITHTLAQMEVDLRRSHDTYAIAPPHKHFKEFLVSFSENDAKVIEEKANIIEEDVDVSRHYIELVPCIISPETFWARYFYRLNVLRSSYQNNNSKDMIKGLVTGDRDDDDEEELGWDDDDDTTEAGKGDADKARISQLEEANSLLKRHVRILTGRVSELEGQLKMAQAHIQAQSEVLNANALGTDNNVTTTNESGKKDPVVVKTLSELDLDLLDDEDEDGWD